MATVDEAKALVAELCAGLYLQGHVSGTGGGISIRVGDRIVMAPSGVMKERMKAADMFVLNAAGAVVETPAPAPPPARPPKLSECAPLFMAAYELRGAGAVLHGHSPNAVLATLLDPAAAELKLTHLEMVKGIAGQGFFSAHAIPIVENTARECELTDRLRAAMAAYPEAQAVLVRRHGVYVWGKDWAQAKTQFECYEYLFEMAVRMRALGLDAGAPPAPPPLPLSAAANGAAAAEGAPAAKRVRGAAAPRTTAVVLDIEGTVAPIAFVAEVLFPYARARLAAHLEETHDSKATRAAVEGLRALAAADAAAGAQRPCPPVAAAADGPAAVAASAAAACAALMDADRKAGPLKSLQGAIWARGFAAGELRAELFGDVASALVAWRAAGVKTYIYSSGSRQAQRDLFAHTTCGDLRPYLSGYFDTAVGAKVRSRRGGRALLGAGNVHGCSSSFFCSSFSLSTRAANDIRRAALPVGARAGLDAVAHSALPAFGCAPRPTPGACAYFGPGTPQPRPSKFRNRRSSLYQQPPTSSLSLTLTNPPPTHPPTQVEAASYEDIALTLGVDDPAELLFVTDAPAEARAAAAAGWRAALAVRPGNVSLPATPCFPVVHSLAEVEL
jgi:methylthioribulose 1-phosphate dehydratase/enolase-phosphatase E1